MNHSKIRKFLIIYLFDYLSFKVFIDIMPLVSWFMELHIFCGSEYPLWKTVADIMDPRIHYAKLLRILWIQESIMQNCCGYYGSENPLWKTVADILDPRIHDAKLEKLFRILWISGSRTQNCCGYYGSADPGCKTVADIIDPYPKHW